MVEFALTIPLSLILMISIMQLGLVLSGYVSVTNVGREAARAAIVSGLTDSQRQTAAYNAVHTSDGTTGTPSGVAKSVGNITGVSVELPALDPVNHPRRKGQTLTAKVTWVITMDIGFLAPTPDITVVSTSKMRIE